MILPLPILSSLCALALGSAPQEAKERAGALLERGNVHFDRSELEAALRDYQEAYALYPSPVVLFNVAQVEEALGHWAQAANRFQDLLGTPDLRPPFAEDAQQRLSELERRLGKLTIRGLGCASELRLDGVPFAQVSIEGRYIEPGLHAVEARCGDGASELRQVQLDAGQKLVLEIEVKDTPRSQPLRLTPTPPGPKLGPQSPGPTDGAPPILQSWWFWALVAAGSAGAVALGVAGARSFSPPNTGLGHSALGDWTRLR